MVDDASAIATIHVRAWLAAFRGLLPDYVLDEISDEHATGLWADLIAGGLHGFTLVAEDDAVTGFCSVSTPSRDDDATPRTAEIGTLYVDPDRWRSGAGRALLERALDTLGTDWDEVTLWVLRDNTDARAFYERFGFAPDGAQKRFRPDRPVQIRMRRSVARASHPSRPGTAPSR